VGDLLRFNRALRANKLLNEDNTTFALNRFERADARPSTRGVAGGAPGVSAVSLEDSTAGVTVIVLSNYDEPVAEDVGKQIFTMLRRGSATPVVVSRTASGAGAGAPSAASGAGGPQVRRVVSRSPGSYRVGAMFARTPSGMTVNGTVPGSPAERAGLIAGDQLLSINGTVIEELNQAAMQGIFGQPREILLVVLRGDDEVETRVTPEKAD
jgi:S1-C subfamily serine protease